MTILGSFPLYGAQDNLLFHGTSSFYLESIKQTGLNGVYPDELYNKIKKFWPYLQSYKKQSRAFSYVPYFLKRQEQVRKTEQISIYFTHNINVAKEFASGSRLGGEGPSFFNDLLLWYLTSRENSISESDRKEAEDLYFQLSQISYYPGVILAFRPKEIDSQRVLGNDNDEVPVWRPIGPEEIFLWEQEKLIPLISTQAEEHLKNLLEKVNISELTEFIQRGSGDKEETENLPSALLDLSSEEVSKYRINSFGKSALSKFAHYYFRVEYIKGKYNIYPEISQK